jgi:hypothetical protein
LVRPEGFEPPTNQFTFVYVTILRGLYLQLLLRSCRTLNLVIKRTIPLQ